MHQPAGSNSMRDAVAISHHPQRRASAELLYRVREIITNKTLHRPGPHPVVFVGHDDLHTLGGAFGATVVVANVLGVGDGFAIQGGIRAFVDIQGMAVDRSGLATNGNNCGRRRRTSAHDPGQLGICPAR